MEADLSNQIPEEFRDRIGWGLYGGIVQFYINGVDGTCAQMGYKLPPKDRLVDWIEGADREHAKLMKGRNKRR